MTTIGQMYKEFQRKLSEKGLKEAVLANIAKKKPGHEELFQLIWQLSDTRAFLRLPTPKKDISKKGKEESNRFRSAGNRLYKEGKLDKALLAYNYAILSGPHPRMTGDTGHAFDTLAFAFANRSALLFEMGQYEAAALDIDLALRHGYPRDKVVKLLDRQSRCFLFLGKKQKAALVLEKALKMSEDTKPEEKLIKGLRKLIEKCKSDDPPVEDYQKKSSFNDLFYTGPRSPPQPTSVAVDIQGKSLMSDALQFAYSASRGRHIVAARDIEPGEVLMSETAREAYVSLDSNLRLYCSTCMKRSPVPLPCPQCSLVVFCSEDCRRRAWEYDRGHKAECALLPLLVHLQPDVDVALTLRLLLSYTLSELKEEVEKIRNEKKDETKVEGGSNGPFFPESLDYGSLYHLQGNLELRKPAQLLETAFSAAFLLYILCSYTNFVDKKYIENHRNVSNEGSGTPGNPISDDSFRLGKEFSSTLESIPLEDVLLMGGQVIRVMLSIQCNAHCIKELHVVKAEPLNMAKHKSVGYGLFTLLSLANHSCNPNALNSSLGKSKFVYSISFIPKGTEVVDSYGERYVSHDIKYRRNNLEMNYQFICECLACQQNWPLYTELPVKFSLRCTLCNGSLDMTTMRCGKCHVFFSSQSSKGKKGAVANSQIYDAQSVQKSIAEAWESYDVAYELLNSYLPCTLEFSHITRLIKLMDKYSFFPNKPYIEAQETLIRFYDLKGSHFFVQQPAS